MKILLMTGFSILDDEIRNQLQDTYDIEDVDVTFNAARHVNEIENSGTIFVINRYLDETDEGEKLISMARELKREFNNLRFIILVAEYDRQVVQPLVNVGLYDIIVKAEVSAGDIEKLIKAPAKEFNFNYYETSIQTSETTDSSSILSKFGPIQNLLTRKEKHVRTIMKETVVFWAPFSDGATTCAVSFASALAEKYGGQVAVISLDMFNPRVEETIGREGKYTLSDVLKSISADTLTLDKLTSLMSESSRNIDFLPSKFSYADHYYLDPLHIKKLINDLRHLYDFTIIDVNRYYTDKLTFTALESADIVYVPIMGTKTDIQRYLEYINEFKSFGDLKTSKFRPIINNYCGSHLTSIEIEQMLGCAPAVYINQVKESKLKSTMRTAMLKLSERR